MASLEKVAINDITKFKENFKDNKDNMTTTDLKKKLIDTIETNQLLQMMDSTQKKTDKSPVESLNELGFSLKDVTSGLKDNVEVYKDLAMLETQKRNAMESSQKELQEKTYELKEKLFEATISSQLEKYHNSISELMKGIKEKKDGDKKDPMNDFGNQVAMKLLTEKIDEIKEQKNTNPFEQLFSSIEIVEQLKSKFRPQQANLPDDPRKYDVELLKFKMEDERLRMAEEKKIELEREKHDTFKYALNTIGTELVDAIGAIAGMLGQMKQNKSTAEQEPQYGIQGLPFQCQKCGGVFILQHKIDNAICPYCGDDGKDDIKPTYNESQATSS